MKTLLLPLLLCGMVTVIQAQTLDLSKQVENITTGSDGTTAKQTDTLEYTIILRNLSASNVTNATLTDNLPAGTRYLTGSTTLNGFTVADVAGRMPYTGAGGLVNSPSYLPGVLATNVPAVITFQVVVLANGGSISNFAALSGTYNGSNIIQNTNTVFTNLSADAACSVIYQSNATVYNRNPGDGYLYKNFRELNTTYGTGTGTPLYYGATGNCYDAITGNPMPAGTVLIWASAMAYEKTKKRIYFINNYDNDPPEELCYIDISDPDPLNIFSMRYTGYPLELNSGDGYNINRMTFAADGYGYAITSNAMDIIRFYVDPVTDRPVVNQLGPLIDDALNGGNSIFDQTGGDIFSDGSGKLYLIANASKLFKINPNTRIATYLGTVTPTPSGASNSIAIDAAGNVYIGGSYNNVYKVNLSTMASTVLPTAGGSSGLPVSDRRVWTSGDYTSCAFPVLAPALSATKTYRNINGSSIVVGGDTVEYTITVTNDGNINAAGVRLYDSIPGTTTYIPNSTTLNGSNVADIGGLMPYSVSGGGLINTSGQLPGIIRPSAAYRAVVRFRVRTHPGQLICNQSRITLVDADGNTIFINTDDPNTTGSQNSTCFYSDGVLSANGLKFRGSLNDDRSVLQWSITADPNVTYYEIQYSENGSYFITAGKVAAKENETSYQFTDHTNTLSGVRYYRLKVVQKGGSESYSGIIRLSLKGMNIQVQPNPFDKQLNLQVQLKTAETVQIRLIDFHGRTVFTSSETMGAGTNAMTLTVPAGLSPGMYVLELITGNKQIYQKKLLKR